MIFWSDPWVNRKTIICKNPDAFRDKIKPFQREKEESVGKI